MRTLNTPRPLALGLAVVLGLAAGLATAEPLGGHPRATAHVDRQLDRMAEQLALSDAQREDIRALLDAHHANADQDRALLREQVDAVLTDDQLARRDALRAEHMAERLDRLGERLDLSATQREEIRAIMDSKRGDPSFSRAEVREQIADVLTDAQRAELRASRGRERDGRGGFDGDLLR